MDYVGNQRSPLWDDMEAMEDENARIGQDLPGLEAEIKSLQAQMTEACRKTRMITCYKTADPEATVSRPTFQLVLTIPQEPFRDHLIYKSLAPVLISVAQSKSLTCVLSSDALETDLCDTCRRVSPWSRVFLLGASRHLRLTAYFHSPFG